MGVRMGIHITAEKEYVASVSTRHRNHQRYDGSLQYCTSVPIANNRSARAYIYKCAPVSTIPRPTYGNSLIVAATARRLTLLCEGCFQLTTVRVATFGALIVALLITLYNALTL
jgi:hypothetical protein